MYVHTRTSSLTETQEPSVRGEYFTIAEINPWKGTKAALQKYIKSTVKAKIGLDEWNSLPITLFFVYHIFFIINRSFFVTC